MRGDPLGIKLHAPLAKGLGAAALHLVEGLGVLLEHPACYTLLTAALYALAASGVLGGFSLQAALAADLTTFLTTHIAALHVYSSLLVTAQLAAAGSLYRLVNPPPPLAPPAGGSGGSREEDDDAADEEKTSKRSADKKNKSSEETSLSFGLTRLEATVAGMLALTPVMLLLPTTLAFYLSYLALHALTVFARAALVFASAALQHPPLHLVALRLWHPLAFPGGLDVTPVSLVGSAAAQSKGNKGGGGGGGGVRYVRLEPRGVSVGTLTKPFFAAAAEWCARTAAAVAGACASCGRLPVALVPFQPDEPEYF